MKTAVMAIGKNDTQKLVDVILTLGEHDGVLIIRYSMIILKRS